MGLFRNDAIARDGIRSGRVYPVSPSVLFHIVAESRIKAAIFREHIGPAVLRSGAEQDLARTYCHQVPLSSRISRPAVVDES